MQLTLPIPGLGVGDEAYPRRPSRRIYCNRSIRLDHVTAVGFDMDYTLAVYKQAEMDRLSIDATVQKMVKKGYPEELLTMQYRTDFPIRGLLIDKKLGNVLKMDRYKYVKKAYHGMNELTWEERRASYHSKRVRPATKRYHWVDTLYSLSEVSVYSACIETLEARGERFSFTELFEDVRSCIDQSHQDGTILDLILEDLPRYVERDEDLPATLHKLRSSGKKLFLLTNSWAEYSDKMMEYLIGSSLPEYPSWKQLFDVIITASSKPAFFTDRRPFKEVLDNGERKEGVAGLERGVVYHGGNIVDFERFTGVGGDEVLYIGDHIYGDVLRAKKDTAWRTMMIIQEMDAELDAMEQCSDDLHRLDSLEFIRRRLLDELRAQKQQLKSIQRRVDESPSDTALVSERVRLKRAVDRLIQRIRAADSDYTKLEEDVDRAFHPFWGSLFKASTEISSFGRQIEDYACLYTTRVTNMLTYSPMHFFRSPRDRMAHELHASGDTPPFNED